MRFGRVALGQVGILPSGWLVYDGASLPDQRGSIVRGEVGQESGLPMNRPEPSGAGRGVANAVAIDEQRDRQQDELQPTDERETTAGPRQGFEDFIRVQYRALVGFLSRRNSPENAEEIAQESIISLLGYREKGQVSDWKPLLYRIAINHSIKRSKREAPHQLNASAIDAEFLADDRPQPDEQAERDQRAEQLQGAIMALPPKCRRVYLLRHGYGLSHGEIAKRCGISVKMVEKHLATAILHLQRQVGVLRGEGL